MMSTLKQHPHSGKRRHISGQQLLLVLKNMRVTSVYQQGCAFCKKTTEKEKKKHLQICQLRKSLPESIELFVDWYSHNVVICVYHLEKMIPMKLTNLQ